MDWFRRYGEGRAERLAAGEAAGRARVVVRDVADVLRAGPATFDLVALDTDNGPDWLLRAANAGLYDAAGVALAAAALRPGGAAVFWSPERYDWFAERLRPAFAAVHEVMAHDVVGGRRHAYTCTWACGGRLRAMHARASRRRLVNGADLLALFPLELVLAARRGRAAAHLRGALQAARQRAPRRGERVRHRPERGLVRARGRLQGRGRGGARGARRRTHEHPRRGSRALPAARAGRAGRPRAVLPQRPRRADGRSRRRTVGRPRPRRPRGLPPHAGAHGGRTAADADRRRSALLPPRRRRRLRHGAEAAAARDLVRERNRLETLQTVMETLIPRLELRKSREDAIRGNGKGY